MGFDSAIDDADLSHAAISEGLKLHYRIKVAVSMHVKAVVCFAAVPPALCKAMRLWKSLFPESSLWSLGMVAFPVLAILSSIMSQVFLNQFFCNGFYLVYVFLSTMSYIYYSFGAPAFQANRGSDPSQALGKFKKIHNYLHYPWLLAEYAFLFVFFYPLLAYTTDTYESGGAEGEALHFSTRYLAHHMGHLWAELVDVICIYFACTFLTMVVFFDLGTHVLLLRTADRQYLSSKDPAQTYEAIASLAESWMPATRGLQSVNAGSAPVIEPQAGAPEAGHKV